MSWRVVPQNCVFAVGWIAVARLGLSGLYTLNPRPKTHRALQRLPVGLESSRCSRARRIMLWFLLPSPKNGMNAMLYYLWIRRGPNCKAAGNATLNRKP